MKTFFIHFVTVFWLWNPMTLLMVLLRACDLGFDCAYDELATYVEKALFDDGVESSQEENK